jgi:hypothetical protein
MTVDAFPGWSHFFITQPPRLMTSHGLEILFP